MEQVDASNKQGMHSWQWGNSFWKFALNNTESSGDHRWKKWLIRTWKSMQQRQLMIRQTPAALNAKAAVTEGCWSLKLSIIAVFSYLIKQFAVLL